MSLGPWEFIIILVICLPFILVIVLGLVLLARRGNLSIGKRLACPYCAEKILPEAKVCPFCKRDLPAEWSKQNA